MAEDRSQSRDDEGGATPKEGEAPETPALARPEGRKRGRGRASRTPASERSRKEEARATSEETAGAKAEEPAGVPVTERPVASRRKISEYVVSVDDETGAIVKIERVDEDTNARTELTQDEYAAAYAFASYAAPYYASYAASLYDPLSSPAAQAYLKTISNYAKAVTGRP